ncbi:MAG: tetratricopeptide repeat protein [Candidatus Hydrogenedentes bacterium]|nr:tetratricopeptide repeat protein [Candidatus Hydrogenedentota bacterium]
MNYQRRRDPSLIRYILAIVLVAAVLLGIYRAVRWFGSGMSTGKVEASAPADLEQARQLTNEGKAEEARKILEPIAAKAKDGDIASTALMLLAKLDVAAGEKATALERLRKAAEDYPGSAEQPRAAAAYARLLEDENRFDEALPIYERIRATAPVQLRAPALTGLGRHAERQQKPVEARDLYREALDSAPWNSPEWNEALDALGQANAALIFSPAATPDSKTYTLERGDNLTSIGIKLNTTLGLLMRANQIESETTLRVGQTLKWTPKDFRIVIERSTCRLFLLDSNGIFKRYSTGLGMPGHETTLGVYKIGNKEKDPTWHKPGEGPIPPGDPRNELGTRWMPFVPVREGLPKDLGIHGTIAPETVGKYSSHGCARLRREDVEELYDLVVRSTPVEVVEVIDPQALSTLALAQS